jgi:protease-4
MRRARFSIPVAVIAVLATMTIMVASAAALELTSMRPVYSYFEGTRRSLPLSTPATTDGPLAIWVNPAALGTGRASGLAYVHTFDDSTFSGDDAVALTLGNLAFAAEFMDLGLGPIQYATHRYTLGYGQRFGRGLYLGASYSWHSSQLFGIDDKDTWSVGALLRPHRKISLGLVMRDLNSPEYLGIEFKPIYEASIGLRPIGDRLTLSADYLTRREELEHGPVESQPKSFVSYGIEFQPFQGLVLRAGADEDENLSGSVTFRFAGDGVTSVFTRVRDEDDEEKTFGAAAVTMGPFWHESVFMPSNDYLEIDLQGTIAETRPPFSLFAGGPRYTLRDLLDKIEYAGRSRGVRAILLRCGEISANLAVLDELRQALLDFRATGKIVIAYLENPGNRVFYLASAADYLVLTPNGYVGLVGLKSEVMFLGGTLEKLGVEAKYVRVGKYKSAPEQVAHKTFTEPGREAYEAVLDDIYDKLVRDIAAGREWPVEKVLEVIDNGPYIPSDAYHHGLVDTLAYWDEVPEIVGKLLKQNIGKLSYGRFAKRTPAKTRWDAPPTIGIVYGVGGILHGSNRRDMLMGDIMGSETILEAFKAMRHDNAVKAVVFRIDSPGGMMTASDKIRRAVELTAKKKPVIVSMGNVAGSGGYHIACDATKIMADEATITGSIGVLNLWLHTRGLYEKIGVGKDIFTRGKHADFFPSWRDVTEEEMEEHQWYVDKYYDKFVADVAKGRGMGVDEVHDVAQGRIWSGKRAEEIGLVDRVGGFNDAIRMAKREAGIADDEDVDFKVLPKPGGLFDAIMARAVARVSGDIHIPDEIRAMLGDAAYYGTFEEPVLYLMPYRIRID